MYPMVGESVTKLPIQGVKEQHHRYTKVGGAYLKYAPPLRLSELASRRITLRTRARVRCKVQDQAVPTHIWTCPETY